MGLFDRNKADKEPRSLRKAREALLKSSPERTLAFVESVIDARPPEEAAAIRETLMVRLSNKLPDFGEYQRGVRDWFSDKKDRASEIFLSRWRQPYAGANAVVTAEHEGERYVAMGEKPVLDPRGNIIGTELVLLGGHMDISTPTRKADRHLGDTALREAIEEAFTYDPKDPDKAKVQALETAQQKLRSIAPVSVSLRSDYGITDTPEKHSVVADYLYNMGTLNELPPIQPTHVSEQRDVPHVHWVPVSQMRKDPTEQVQQFGSDRSRYYIELEDGNRINVRDNQGPGLEAALTKLGVNLGALPEAPMQEPEAAAEEPFIGPKFTDLVTRPAQTQKDEITARRERNAEAGNTRGVA